MVKIRLSRIGARSQPYYRVVVVDERKKRDGRVLETIGTYNPRTEPSSFTVDQERLKYWRSVGAQPTEPILVLLGEGQPKRHQEKNKQAEVAATPAAPAPAESSPTEGAETVATEAPETTPTPSPELAEVVAASEQVSPVATPEVIAETVETKEVASEQAALQNEPTTQEESASSAEVAEEQSTPTETPTPSGEPEPTPSA